MIRRFPGLLPAAAVLATIAGLSSCDWTGGSDSDFNTSRGGLNINLSGFYKGLGSGGRAVSNTTGGQINNFTIQQSGNVLEVLDSNGQKYRGNVGSPLAVAAPSALGVIPTGAQLANFQVNWNGTDGVAAKEVQFTGVVNVVAVTDIRGTTSRRDNLNSNSQTVDNTSTATTAKTSTSGTTTTTTVVDGVTVTQQVILVPGGPAVGTETDSNTTTTTTTTGNTNNTGSNSSSTVASNSTNQSSNASATEQTFALSDANTQYRLRGTWIEAGGVTANVDALSPGAGGVLVVLAAGQNASNITTPAQPQAPALP
jgi:hypothetical protein